MIWCAALIFWEPNLQLLGSARIFSSPPHNTRPGLYYIARFRLRWRQKASITEQMALRRKCTVSDLKQALRSLTRLVVHGPLETVVTTRSNGVSLSPYAV